MTSSDWRERVRESIISAPKWSQAGLLLLLALVIWLPRAFELDRFVATDEVPWLWRSANFYYALAQRDFATTYLNKSPGVVTMWVETFAYLLKFPEYRGLGQGILGKYMLLESLLKSAGVDPHDILVTSRVIMVSLNTLVLAMAFIYVRRIVGTLPALVGFLLIAFDPYHLALSRLAHLDAPMGNFMFLSLVALLDHFYGSRCPLSLLVSAVAGGLAVLAKVPGFIILPIVGFITLVKFLEGLKDKPSEQSSKTTPWLSQLIRPLAIWGVVFLIAFVAVFPAAWVNPVGVFFDLTFSPLETGRVVVQSRTAPEEAAIAEAEAQDQEKDSGRGFDHYLRYPLKFLWRTTPVILVGLALAGVFAIWRSVPFDKRKIRRSVRGIMLFVLIYTILITIPLKSSSKYYIPVYPALDLVAGMGWFGFGQWVADRFALALRKFVANGVLLLVVLTQMASALTTFPYYFTYFNPLLGGSRRAGEVLSIGSGEGLDQAAEYLNKKSGAERLKVMSGYGIGPFSYYFVGKSYMLSGQVWNTDKAAILKEMDYLVIYAKQWHRQIPAGLFPIMNEVQPEYSVWIHGIEFARIYKVATLPPEVFNPGK